jgi:hypothetical protein
VKRTHRILLAAAATALLGAAALAGVREGSLRISREDAVVRLDWEGELAGGESWTVSRGALDELSASGRNDEPVLEGLTEATARDDDAPDGSGSHYWLVEGRVSAPACNGNPALCSRRFDEVAYATTHNAMSSEQDSWILPNQTVDVPAQLDSGVRALMLDVHDFFGEPHLCHGTCLGGFRPLDEGLVEIREFLDANPREIIGIIFECYSDIADVEAAFADSGLLPHCHEQTPGEPWPTLQEMIDADRRLVVMTDNQGGSRPWYHDVWQLAWETHFSVERVEDFTCDRNRGSAGNALFILNHFLTAPSASRALAEQANANPAFLERALECEAASGSLPNFVTVDFHDIGDVMAVVEALNAR